jgi:hypothetical protein
MPIGTAKSYKKSIVVDGRGIVGSVGSRKSEENVRRELI